MIVFRLCRSRYTDFLSGLGAEKYGGRWNSKGVSLVYTSSSRSLCTTELAVHLPLGIVPADFRIASIEIPVKVKIKTITVADLAADWRVFPHPFSTKLLGDGFVKKNKHAVCKVPSAVVPGDFNFLLNPHHKDFHLIKVRKVEDFEFDERLFKR
jgi:RES domain-containing protein